MSKRSKLTPEQREKSKRLQQFIAGVHALAETYCKDPEEIELFLAGTYMLEMYDPVFGTPAPSFRLVEFRDLRT